jgi:4a-hydroxytetrahydrobiopterin dehydratase
MWTEKDNALQRTFKFQDFIEAWAFMTEVAFHAEKLKHHPNWSNSYNTVEFTLNTHDKGDIVTKKDRDLAEAIDGVYQKFKPYMM